MAGFATARLADVAEVKGGKRLPANANLVANPTAHPYIRGRDIRDGKITFDDPVYVLDEDFEKIKRYTVDSGDVCITIVGNIGDVGITPPSLHRASLTENAVKLVNLREDIDALFLMYARLTPDAQHQMKLSAAGAAQPKLGIYKVNEIKVPAPPLPIQRRIASILSAYDELIENNQRRIKILESMARALYREWFVHFRFPGYESVPRVPSPLGEIPQGWEVKKLGDVFQTVLGGTPSRARPEFWVGGTVPWINSGKVNDLRITEASELITDLALEKSAAKLMPKGTTVLAITGATLGQVSYLEIETAANQSVVGIVDSSALRSEWVYLAVRERIKGIIKQASGGAQQHINKEIVNDVQVCLPPDSLAKDFKTVVASMFREVATLLFQIQNLRRTRDLLLPRLLSGQIDVEAIDHA